MHERLAERLEGFLKLLAAEEALARLFEHQQSVEDSTGLLELFQRGLLLQFNLGLEFVQLLAGHLLDRVPALFDHVAFRLHFNEGLGGLIGVLVGLGLHVEVDAAALVEALHGLVEVAPRVHLEALLPPLRLVGGSDDGLEDLHLLTHGLLAHRIQHQLLGDYLDDVESLPKSLDRCSGSRIALVVNDERFLGAGDGSVEQLEL